MPSSKQLTGMRGVYIVAAELSRQGFIASPTSRSAYGADLLVTDADCKRAFSIQVKTKSTSADYWLLSNDYKRLASRSHVYVFVNIRKDPLLPQFFVIPSIIVQKKGCVKAFGKYPWCWFNEKDANPYQDKWEIFRGR